MVTQFASIREKYDTSVVTINTVIRGNLTSQSGYLFISGRNRAGRNLLSEGINFTVATGEKLQIQIENTIRQAGEDLFFVLISYHPSNNPLEAKQIAKWKAKNDDQTTLRSLPFIIEISNDEDFNTAAVTDSNELPTNPVNGIIREVIADSRFYEYDSEAIIGTYPVISGGYWVETTFSGNTYLESTIEEGGSDRPLTLIESFIQPPQKIEAADSTRVRFWVLNGKREDGGTPLPQGYSINLQITINGATTSFDGISYATIFAGLTFVNFLGYVRIRDGLLDTFIPGVGADRPWNPIASPLNLSQELPRGYAAAYEIFFRFTPGQLQGRIPNGANIGVLLYEEGLVGKPSSLSLFLGDIVLPRGDRLRIFPGIRGSGQAVAKGFEMPTLVGESEYFGLLPDTDNQIAAMSVALAGDITIRQSREDLLDTEVIRGFVGTLPGVAAVSENSNIVTLVDNDALQITVNHPINSNNRWNIRSDYDDVIAGITDKATEIPPLMRIFIGVNGTIFQWNTEPNVTLAASQEILITDISSSNIINSLPNIPNNFGLYRPNQPNITVNSGSGSLIAGDYQVWIAYYYPSPNNFVTKISHNFANGAISEFDSTLAETTLANQYWRSPVSDITALKALTSSELVNFHVRAIPSQQSLYLYDNNSDLIDNGDSIIQPVSGNGAFIKLQKQNQSSNLAVNRETLTGDKQLNIEDAFYQYLNPGGANRSVILPNPPVINTGVVIKNLDGNFDLEIKENASGETIQVLGNSSNRFQMSFTYDGVEWHGWG